MDHGLVIIDTQRAVESLGGVIPTPGGQEESTGIRFGILAHDGKLNFTIDIIDVYVFFQVGNTRPIVTTTSQPG